MNLLSQQNYFQHSSNRALSLSLCRTVALCPPAVASVVGGELSRWRPSCSTFRLAAAALNRFQPGRCLLLWCAAAPPMALCSLSGTKKEGRPAKHKGAAWKFNQHRSHSGPPSQLRVLLRLLSLTLMKCSGECAEPGWGNQPAQTSSAPEIFCSIILLIVCGKFTPADEPWLKWTSSHWKKNNNLCIF